METYDLPPIIVEQVEPGVYATSELVAGLKEKAYPISELFGPTRQGEGPQAGMECYFLRFAGCDFTCSWCDTGYAINPSYPGWHKDMMSAGEIMFKLTALGASSGSWIILSGGNPALFVDDNLTEAFHAMGYKLSMETQGSVLLKGSGNIDCLVVSPKPPSSGMADRFKPDLVADLVKDRDLPGLQTTIKFVAFNLEDMEWALDAKAHIESSFSGLEDQGSTFNSIRWFMSAGTPLSMPVLPDVSPLDIARLTVCNSMTDLWLRALNDPEDRFRDFVLLPQLHVLVWGQRAGV